MPDLPPLVPVPPSTVRNSIPSDEWEACLDAWVLLIEIRLRLSSSDFETCASADESTTPFLLSYFKQLASAASGDALRHADKKTRNLRKSSFLLTRRLILDTPSAPTELLDWTVLGDLCDIYHASPAVRNLIAEAWQGYHDQISSSVEGGKGSIIERLSLKNSSRSSDVLADIRRLTILAFAHPAIGHVLMTGSDYLDSFVEAYQANKNEELRKALVANIYIGFTSLIKQPKPNMSLLLDHLFGLKATARVGTSTGKTEANLLSDLICSTDILSRMDHFLKKNPQKRGQDLVAALRTYQSQMQHIHHRYQKEKRVHKGKNRANDDPFSSTPLHGELHAHKMSLIVQIQDLFPDLGSGYIVRLLDFYSDNAETVIAHLLDNSLDPQLQTLDKSEQLPEPGRLSRHDVMAPRSTPPPLLDEAPPATTAEYTRRNIFDDDDLVHLAHNRSATTDAKGKLLFGRADADLTADTILADRTNHETKKAAILSALATFDSDDDERDDTYDIADVGGTVDTTTTGQTIGDQDTDRESQPGPHGSREAAAGAAEETELKLFQMYQSNPALFARDSATRRSQPRTSLKHETGMTDEAIEGWAVMLSRDPKRVSRLESGLLAPGGGSGAPGAIMQPKLASTAYRKPTPGGADETEDSETGSDGRTGGGAHRGRGRGRARGGRGRGTGRGGGNVAGPSGDKDTSMARQRKDANKASRANHSRRDQRAKKMARAGGLVG